MRFIREWKKKIYGQLLPTDKEIFDFIYKEYYVEFMNYDKENNKTRITKNYISIDISKIAKHFGVDNDIIFSRFYYVYKEKYDYQRENRPDVYFFMNKLEGNKNFEDEIHLVHFPYLTSILAKLEYDEEKFHISTLISIIAVIISFGSLLMLLINKS